MKLFVVALLFILLSSIAVGEDAATIEDGEELYTYLEMPVDFGTCVSVVASSAPLVEQAAMAIKPEFVKQHRRITYTDDNYVLTWTTVFDGDAIITAGCQMFGDKLIVLTNMERENMDLLMNVLIQRDPQILGKEHITSP